MLTYSEVFHAERGFVGRLAGDSRTSAGVFSADVWDDCSSEFADCLQEAVQAGDAFQKWRWCQGSQCHNRWPIRNGRHISESIGSTVEEEHWRIFTTECLPSRFYKSSKFGCFAYEIRILWEGFDVLQDIPDCDYEVRDRPILEKILDMEFAEPSLTRGIFYSGNNFRHFELLPILFPATVFLCISWTSNVMAGSDVRLWLEFKFDFNWSFNF